MKAKKSQPIRKDERTESWLPVRQELEEWFIGESITECELKLPGCMRTFGLAFAHSLKRRFISPPKNILDNDAWEQYRKIWREVVLACQYCHSIIEAYGEKKEPKMSTAVRDCIKRRGKCPK